MSHPLTAPEGVRTQTTAQGLSVHTHETWVWITQGSNMTHLNQRVWRGALSVVLHKCSHTHTHDGYIIGSERGPWCSAHLPKTDVKNNSEGGSD